MGRSFSLLDLPSQAIAVQRLLKGLSEQEKLSWLATHGEILLMPIGPPTRRIYRFVSTIGMECIFFIDDEEFVFFGDHSTYTMKEPNEKA